MSSLWPNLDGSAAGWLAVPRLARALARATMRGRRVAIVDVSGGLGNQLFQYAFGRYLESRGFETVYEIRRLLPGADQVGRTYRLHPLQPRTIVLPSNRLLRGALWRAFGMRLRFEREKFAFVEVGAAPSRSALFAGFWQHAHYAAAGIGNLRAVLAGIRVDSEIMAQPGIVVGARRGDFTSDGTHRWKIGALAPEYYTAALREAPRGLPIHLFSDESEWAEEVLRRYLEARFSQPVRVVRGDFDDWQTLALMSRGAFHVIANSTFHWWGAALSTTSRGCIAPEPWQRPLTGRCGILPPEWRTVTSVFE